MEVIKNEYLQESYIGQKIAEFLAIDYDENKLLAAGSSNKVRQQRRELQIDVK